MTWRTFFGSWSRAAATSFFFAVAFATVAPDAFERTANHCAVVLGTATERVVTAVATVVSTAVVRALNSRAGQDLLTLGILVWMFRLFFSHRGGDKK